MSDAPQSSESDSRIPMAVSEGAPNEISRLRRIGRGAWCGAYAGAVGGAVAMILFVFAVTDSTTSQKYQIVAWLLCALLGALVGNWLLGKRLRPYGSAAVLAALIAVAALEVTLYLVITTPGAGLGSPLLYGLLFGALPGALLGAIVCALLAMLPLAVTDALQPWGWLMAGSAATLIFLWSAAPRMIQDGQIGEWQPIAAYVVGFILAGWIAQNEYLRLRKGKPA